MVSRKILLEIYISAIESDQMPPISNSVQLFWVVKDKRITIQPKYLSLTENKLVFNSNCKMALNFKIDPDTQKFSQKISVFELVDQQNGKTLWRFKFDMGKFANYLDPDKPVYKSMKIKSRSSKTHSDVNSNQIISTTQKTSTGYLTLHIKGQIQQDYSSVLTQIKSKSMIKYKQNHILTDQKSL